MTEYDYIIAGAGTAGCFSASRLPGNAATTVLAIEVEESDVKQIMSRIPAGLTKR
jgi:choline dehydrogenase